VDDAEALERIRGLAIPPAWRDVWICLDPLGHLQATGVDAAGRQQYRYHDRWRVRRDRQKFADMVEFGRALPRLRRRVTRDLRGDDTLTRSRVLAYVLAANSPAAPDKAPNTIADPGRWEPKVSLAQQLRLP